MSSNKNIQEAFKSILSIKNDKEKIENFASIIQLNIMNEISNLMQAKGINKKQLAEKLGVSKSYITQLFSVDKSINLKLIAQIQDIFDVKFNASFQPKKDNVQRAYMYRITETFRKVEVYKKISYNIDELGIDLDINNNPRIAPTINQNPCLKQIDQSMVI